MVEQRKLSNNRSGTHLVKKNPIWIKKVTEGSLDNYTNNDQRLTPASNAPIDLKAHPPTLTQAHMGGIQTQKSSKGGVAEYPNLLPDLTKLLHDGIKPSAFALETKCVAAVY
jgi:hypothetical protein